MKRLPLLLLLLPILTSCPGNKPGNAEEPPHWAEMKTSFSWKEFYDTLAKLGRIQHKLYYDPSTMSIAHYCPLTKEEREILSSFNTKFFPPAREYTTHTFKEVAEKKEKLGKRLEDSVGIRNGRPSDKHLSALEKLERYTESSLKEAFQSGYIQWNDSEKKLTYSGTNDAEKAALNELNEQCLRDFLASYAGTAGLELGKASDIVNTYLKSRCVVKEPGKDGDKPKKPTIGWDDRNALFMVLRNVTPKQDGGNASKKQLKAFSLYYADKADLNVQKIKAGSQEDLDITLYEDYQCSDGQKVGTVSSGALLYRPHNQLLQMVPNGERGYSRAVFFKNRDACQEYLKWEGEPGSQNPPAVSLEEKNEIQAYILGGPLENKYKKNSRGKTFDDYGIAATEPATGLAGNSNRDILFPIVNHTGDDLRKSGDDDSGDNTNGVANIRDKAGNVYGDRLYGVLSVTNQDTIPQSDVEEALSETPKEGEPAEKDVNVLQIYFVMDLTGSMKEYKDDILDSLDVNFIKPYDLRHENARMDAMEFGFIGYKDYPDQNCNQKGETRPRGHRIASFEFPGRGDGATDCAYNYTHQGMVGPREFKYILRQVKTAGQLAEGNAAEQRRVAQDPVPEAMRYGLAKAIDPAAWRSPRDGEGRRHPLRVIFVISDAPDHLGAETFGNGIAKHVAQWANTDANMVFPIYIRDLRKQSNRKYDETAMNQFKSLGVSAGFIPLELGNTNDDLVSQFNEVFGRFSRMLTEKIAAQDLESEEARKKVENSLSDEQISKEYADDPQTQEQMLQAAAMARHAFGCTMSVWVSKEKKKELSAFSAIREPLWVATKDPYSFAGGAVKDGKVEVYPVMKPGVMLSIKDAEMYLGKCEAAMKIYKESTSGHNAEQRDLQLIARLAANFLASSVQPGSLLNAAPEELSRIFEQGSGDFRMNKDLPVQSRFALELLKIMGENKGTVNVQPLIEAFSDRVEIFKKRLAGAKEFPLEQRVFYTQDTYHKVHSIYRDNVDKGAEEIRNIVNTDDINGKSAIVVPYDELP